MIRPMLNPTQFARRRAAGAPLEKGVKGRDQALMAMNPGDRFAAEAKTKVRAQKGPLKGQPFQNVVGRGKLAVTGSTSKTKKFSKSPGVPGSLQKQRRIGSAQQATKLAQILKKF